MSRLLPLLLLAGCATAGLPAGAPATAPPFQVSVVGKGPPMVFIPGLATPGEVWTEVVAHYQDRFECHVLSLAGFGGQAPVPGPLLPQVQEALVRYLQEHRLERPVVVGHSLGGFLGLWLASAHPELVGRLVVVDAAPSLAALQDPSISEAGAALAAGQMRERLRMATPDQRVQFGKQSARGLVTAPAQQERVAGWSLRSDPDTVSDAMYFVMTHDLRPELPKVRAPALVLGTWAGYAPYLTRQEVLQRFQDQYRACGSCRVALAERARHFVMLDDLPNLTAAVDGFLQESARSASLPPAR